MKKKQRGTISATDAALKYIKSRPNNVFSDTYDGIDAMAALSRRKKKNQKFRVKYARIGKEKAMRLDDKTKKRLEDEAISFIKSEHGKILKDVSFGLTGNGVTKCGTMRSFIEYMSMILRDALELRERLGLNELDVKFVKKTACTGVVELSFPNATEIEADCLCRMLAGNSYDWIRCHGESAGYYTTFVVEKCGKKVLFKYENA